jgi:hypothetical protein
VSESRREDDQGGLTCTGTNPLSELLNLRSGSIETVSNSSAQFRLSPRSKLTLGRVLVDMSSDGLASDNVLCDSILIDSHRCEYTERPRVDLRSSVRDDADDDLLPSVGSPCLGTRARGEVLDVL